LRNNGMLTGRQCSIRDVKQHQRHIDVDWEAQHLSQFDYTWLRDNCQCSSCVHTSSGQKLHTSAEIDANVRPLKLERRQGNGNNGLSSSIMFVRWSDTHESQFPTEWLRRNCYAHQISQPKFTSTWQGKDLAAVPSLSYSTVMETTEGLKSWLHQLAVFGISLMQSVPVKEQTVGTVAARICYLRETMYGKIWDVVNVPNPNNIAYSNLKIDFHQDLMYYEAPPGLQFLHCLKSAEKGGETLFIDGFKAAEILKDTDPASFSALTQIPSTYHKNGTDHSLYFRRPIISVDEHGELHSINYGPPFEGPLHVPFNLVQQYYGALRAFSKIVNSPELQYRIKLQPGDLISFNNRRVIHGRTEFDASEPRHLQGTYVDLDEFESQCRIVFAK